jgi:hypothetical protein
VCKRERREKREERREKEKREERREKREERREKREERREKREECRTVSSLRPERPPAVISVVSNSLVFPSLADTYPDLVCSSREVHSLALIPSSTRLTHHGFSSV